MEFDVAVIGAGPSGLCFSRMLANLGLSVVIIEQSPLSAIEHPGFDGREVALTHESVNIMRKLGLWAHIPSDAISRLRNAHVFNGPSLYAMKIDHSLGGEAELGYLIANCHIRKAAYETTKDANNITLLAETRVSTIAHDSRHVVLTMADSQRIHCKLLVAADSRFSETRRMMGISTTMHDFGRTMMVCVMKHENPHLHTAWEWFDYGQTLALLPMNGSRSSVVITLPAQEIANLMAMTEEMFNEAVTERFKHRLGAMRLDSTRHAYPLVSTYPRQFVAQRFALIGDAAVGMHPVTAHGFNFGLKSASTLSQQIAVAADQKKDIASPEILSRYERSHRAATRPLFIATHFISKLYGNDTPPARLIRHVALRVGNRFLPFKRSVAKALTTSH